MRIGNISTTERGWFIGDFPKAILQTRQCEAAEKRYKAGDYEPRHHHPIATEVSIVSQGDVAMNGKILRAGNVVVMPPNKSTDFQALTDAVSFIVKIPSLLDDKIIGPSPTELSDEILLKLDECLKSTFLKTSQDFFSKAESFCRKHTTGLQPYEAMFSDVEFYRLARLSNSLLCDECYQWRKTSRPMSDFYAMCVRWVCDSCLGDSPV